MGITREMLSVQIAEPLVGETGHPVGKAAGNNGQEKEWQTHYERFPPDCRAPHDVQTVFKSFAAVGGAAGVVAEFEEGTGIAMSWTEVQGVEMGAGRCTVCWYRLEERGTGSDGVEGQDGCDDRVEKTKDGGP